MNQPNEPPRDPRLLAVSGRIGSGRNLSGSIEPARQRPSDESAFAPTAQELERLLFAVETSLQINRRFQFFLWVQGVFQAFLPHQTLICAFGNLDAENYVIDAFSSEEITLGAQNSNRQAARGLVEAAAREWLRRGREPLLWSTEQQQQHAESPLTQGIWELGLGHTLVHGTREISGEGGSLFIFGRLERAPMQRSRQVVELFLPFLHFSLYRYGPAELAESQPRDASALRLSDREIDIMRGIRDGKTNAEIGATLGISPLTVKNHIQRILKKINVNNRAQAVARCLAMRVFEHD